MENTTTKLNLDNLDLKLSKTIVKLALENSFHSIMITTSIPGYPIVYVNEAFCELTGYEAEEVIGKSPGILQGPKTDPAVLDQLSDDLFNGRVFHGRTVNYPKVGEPFLMEWKIFPVPDEKEEIKYYLAVQRDVSK